MILFYSHMIAFKQNEEVLKLGEEIEATRKNENERQALMQKLHEGRMRELEEKVTTKISIQISKDKRFPNIRNMMLDVSFRSNKRKWKEKLDADFNLNHLMK